VKNCAKMYFMAKILLKKSFLVISKLQNFNYPKNFSNQVQLHITIQKTQKYQESKATQTLVVKNNRHAKSLFNWWSVLFGCWRFMISREQPIVLVCVGAGAISPLLDKRVIIANCRWRFFRKKEKGEF
jgi:predicted DCC family thiol-disulfide oxidoreductase YuxK